MADNLYLDALERLNGPITEGWRRDLREANTAALATADTNARPSVRIVNILSIEERGLSFVAITKSRGAAGKGNRRLASIRLCSNRASCRLAGFYTGARANRILALWLASGARANPLQSNKRWAVVQGVTQHLSKEITGHVQKHIGCAGTGR